VMQVIEVARSVSGRDIPVRIGPRRPGDPAVLVASSQRIMRDLSWRPRLQDLREIVRSAWKP
jgi:UDP-glucose 4-epimerase